MAKTTKPDATGEAPEQATIYVQVQGNVHFCRGGVEKSWRDGDYLSFTLEEFDALPAELKARCKALDAIEIKKG